MSVDVVCAGPAYLDLTFDGLEAIPRPGEERFARDLHASAGGTAITAIGLARLGLRTALVAPVGADVAGTMIREILESEGVEVAGPEASRTPVTVVLPVAGERSFVTFEPGFTLEREEIGRLEPNAVVVGLDHLDAAPAGAEVYATVGDPDATRYAGQLPDLSRLRALVANRSEALRLTGEATAQSAALALAESAATAVVTCGADGAVAAAADGEIEAVPAPLVEARDTTGAGDLFMAAYVHADLAGEPLLERLRQAVVYASLSVRTATGAGSASTLEELRRAVAELDPAMMQEQTAKEPLR
jgi:sugar/nucleoside kinase (ribokinase family)